jgi:PAS domain S-box-containing protein
VRLFRRSFRVSVIVVTVLVTMIAAAAMGFTHYKAMRRRSESDLAQLLKLSATESATRVARWLQDRRDAAAKIAANTTLVEELRRIDHLDPEEDEYFLALYRLKRELDQSTLDHSFIYEITIHDDETEDVFLASAGEDVEFFSAEDDDVGVKEAKSELWTSQIIPANIPLPDETGASADSVPCMLIAAPIDDGTDLYGVLRLRVRVLDIGDNLLRAAIYSEAYSTSDAYVVNRDGVFLSPSHFEKELKAAGRISKRSMLELKTRPPNQDEFTQAFQLSRELIEGPRQNGVDVSGYQSLRGQTTVGAWARVKGTDWVCIAEIDSDEAFAPLARLTRTSLYVSLGIGALVVCLSTLLVDRIAAPLRDLAGVATKLASGDRSVRCQIDRDDEIGTLAAALDNMADAVEQSLTDLEKNADHLAQSNRQLESELAERHRIEQELLNANAFLDSVIDNIPTMLFMKDADNLRFVRFNKAGEELVGLPRDQLVGKTDFDLYPPEEARFFAAKDRDVLNGMKMVEVDEEELMTKAGIRILHTKKIPICDKHGKPQILLGISEDITEKKKTLEAIKAAKEAAEAANQAKGDFLANMSHEIRTPMNAIIGMTDLVLDTELNSTQRDYLTIVAESAESLLSIINQILDFSKIEAGKLELETVDFDVREEVGDTVRSLGMHAHAKDLELTWHVHADVPKWLSGDAIRLRQVLINLVGNAIKFTIRGEIYVEVQCEAADDWPIMLHVSVRDTGVGIPAEKQQQIFAAFEQADTSTTREFGGTGLGLAITSSIAIAMNGRVWVESSPGDGSTFHFSGKLALGTQPHEDEALPDLNGLRVLVVDDNATNRLILEETLQSWGMVVETVEGGRQAIAALQNAKTSGTPFSLVISDVHMPLMDGFMLADQLRSMEAFRDTVLIMLTSGGRAGDVRRCEQLGVRAHLMKPVKQSELLDAIVDAVNGYATGDSVAEAGEEIEALPPLNILLVEDGRTNQIVAVGLLSKWGHAIDVAENGEEAVKLWESKPFDVVLMDVQMPVMDGLDATRRIRQLEGDRRTPIVAMTARAMTGDRERCLDAGMDDYISKPVRKLELYRVLRSLTDRQKESRIVRRDAPHQTLSTQSNTSVVAKIIDWDAALANLDGDRDLLEAMVQASIQECQELITQLDEAIAGEDAKVAERLAHTIKGATRAIAATATMQAAAAVEASTAQGDLEAARHQYPVLREAIEQLANALTQRT